MRRLPALDRARLLGLALAGLVAVLVMGIVGMHGLVGHGAAPSAGPSLSSYDAHAGHSAPAQTADGEEASSTPGGHGVGDMILLCASMLAAAALILIARLVAGAVRRLRLKVFAPLAARAPALIGVLGSGPPSAWRFSVIRC